MLETEKKYIKRITKNVTSNQQKDCLRLFLEGYKTYNLDIRYYSFERYYSEYCNRNNLENDVTINQLEGLR